MNRKCGELATMKDRIFFFFRRFFLLFLYVLVSVYMKDRRSKYLGKMEVKRKSIGESGKVSGSNFKISLTTFACQFMGGDFFRSCYRRANGRGLRTHVQKV